MTSQYTPVLNQDIEKQPLQNQNNGYQPQWTSNNNATFKKSSKIALITLGLLGVTFIGHFFGSPCSNSMFISNQKQQETTHQDWLASPLNINDVLNKNTVAAECTVDTPLHLWEGQSIYQVPHSIKGLHVVEKTEKIIKYIRLMNGKINVVENKDLDQTKITFDIKLSEEIQNESINIEEEETEDDYNLAVVIKDGDGKSHNSGCVQINALIEIPSLNELNNFELDTITNDINIGNEFEFKNSLQLSNIAGDLTVNKIKATSIKLKNVSGDIQGVFDLTQGQFITDTTSGDIKVTFDHISPGSTIISKSVNGKTDIQVPTDFESKFKLSSTLGKVNVEATNSDILHYTRSHRMFGQTIKGSYGVDENADSEINASTLNGEIKLTYQ
ncbi:hypothetical protein BJ944DRAFT_246375 [Cunninghamella echinulata]|nr:hypothetical protein BJ944DRAFT_246375 [Cunninghamella echinulata]